MVLYESLQGDAFDYHCLHILIQNAQEDYNQLE